MSELKLTESNAPTAPVERGSDVVLFSSPGQGVQHHGRERGLGSGLATSTDRALAVKKLYGHHGKYGKAPGNGKRRAALCHAPKTAMRREALAARGKLPNPGDAARFEATEPKSSHLSSRVKSHGRRTRGEGANCPRERGRPVDCVVSRYGKGGCDFPGRVRGDAASGGMENWRRQVGNPKEGIMRLVNLGLILVTTQPPCDVNESAERRSTAWIMAKACPEVPVALLRGFDAGADKNRVCLFHGAPEGYGWASTCTTLETQGSWKPIRRGGTLPETGSPVCVSGRGGDCGPTSKCRPGDDAESFSDTRAASAVTRFSPTTESWRNNFAKPQTRARSGWSTVPAFGDRRLEALQRGGKKARVGVPGRPRS
jgi:hypothetical protein